MCVHIPKQYVVSLYLSLHTYQWKHTMCVLILFPSLNIMVLRFIYWMHVAVVDSFSLLCCIRYEYNPSSINPDLFMYFSAHAQESQSRTHSWEWDCREWNCQGIGCAVHFYPD